MMMTAFPLRYALLAGWMLLLAVTPLIADNYTVRIAITVAMYSAMALSWNFIGGFAGYPSFSTAAFFGLGCYVGALAQRSGVPMVLAWALATLFVTAFAVALGAIILRLKGHYFAIGSIAVVEVVRLVISSWGSLTGGGDGLNVPLIAGGPDRVAATVLYVMLAVMLAAFVATVLVDRARLGFGLRCINQNEDAADMVGIDTTRYKIMGYALSALFCGTVGAIYASWVHYIEPPDVFDVMLSVKPLVMVLLGGLGTIFGPAIGAFLLLTFEEFVWRTFLTVHAAALGIIIVALVLFLPNGVLSLTREKLGLRRRAGGEKR